MRFTNNARRYKNMLACYSTFLVYFRQLYLNQRINSLVRDSNSYVQNNFQQI